MTDMTQLGATLDRIAEALERLAPPKPIVDLNDDATVFVWQTKPDRLIPVKTNHSLPVELLKGVEPQKQKLMSNTLQFAKGFPANNALLWGARGTGKSSLVKAIHAAVNAELDSNMALIEVQREDITSLPRLMRHLADSDRRFLLFCDDLSFENQDENYKSLKSILEGGVEARPNSVLFYATSNRRHLMSRQMIENERAGAIHKGEAVEEKVSLSDRFGLWVGFHNMDQETYLNIVFAYVERVGLEVDQDHLRAKALEWSVSRGARSGRVAWQFFTDLCGQHGINSAL